MTLTLNRNPQSNTYCVPAALALITGLHVDDITFRLNALLDDQPITAVYIGFALKVLKSLDYEFKLILKTNELDKSKIYLVEVPGHALVYHDEKIWDNAHPQGQMYKPMAHLYQKSLRFYEVARAGRVRRETMEKITNQQFTDFIELLKNSPEMSEGFDAPNQFTDLKCLTPIIVFYFGLSIIRDPKFALTSAFVSGFQAGRLYAAHTQEVGELERILKCKP